MSRAAELTVTDTPAIWQLSGLGEDHLHNVGGGDVYIRAYHTKVTTAEASLAGTAAELDEMDGATKLPPGRSITLRGCQSVSIVRASDGSNVTVRQGVGLPGPFEPIEFASTPGASDTGYSESQVGYVVNAAGDLTFYRYLGTDAGGDAVWREVVHLNEDGELVGPILLEEYTIAELGDFTPTENELILDEDGGLRIGDGSTTGDDLNTIWPHADMSLAVGEIPTIPDGEVLGKSLSVGLYNTQSGGGEESGRHIQVGYNNTQSGAENAQFGFFNTQSGYYNIQSGYRNTQSGDFNAQFGYDNIQSGEGNIQSGEGNDQDGLRNTQSGYFNTQSGLDSIQGGRSNEQNGGGSLQVGADNTQKSTGDGGGRHLQGGEGNDQDGRSNIQSGWSNEQSGDYGLQFGEDASDEYSDGNAWNCVLTQGGGSFDVDGDAQIMRFIVRREVTHDDSTWSDLLIDGDDRLVLPVDSVWTFTAKVVGTTTGIGKAFSYVIEGCIENNGGTTTVNAATVTTVHEDDSDFDCQVVTGANDDLQIQVQDATGGGDTVRWVASVDAVQVIYA